MSDWVKIRDSFEDALKLDDVGMDMKNKAIGWFEDTGIDVAQAFVNRVNEECKKDAVNEQGWCKIRDAFIIPIALNVGMYMFKTVIQKAKDEHNQRA